ncbi:MAG: glycerol-3-phosphate acyltransferase [Anaerolineae bacterium]|nr:glycerol-3-phosphate acyltransferase [Anaerolineae bacterium]
MTIISTVAVLIISYLVGSIPDGLLVARLFTGKDVRKIESGRTGGTNVMRAAGYPAGIITVILDVLKGIAATWITLAFFPAGNAWVQVFAALLAITGHNYSIFMIEKSSTGQWRLRGGAGGSTCLGGAAGIYPGALLFILPFAIVAFFVVGYASVATLAIAAGSIIVFAYMAVNGYLPWAYVFYGIGSLALLMWALRPNITRLMNGTERAVGLRAYFRKKKDQKPQ